MLAKTKTITFSKASWSFLCSENLNRLVDDIPVDCHVFMGA